MKNAVSFSLLLASTLAFSACAPKASVPTATKELEDYKVEMPDIGLIISEALAASLYKGGQPGAVQVTGVVVHEEAKLDPRIHLVHEGGVGKDGKKAAVMSSFQATFSSENTSIDLKEEAGLNNLVAVGCSDEVATEAARSRSLHLQASPTPQAQSILYVQAKTIILCGDLGSGLQNAELFDLTFAADEIVMNQVGYARINFSGSIVLKTNKLVLNGESTMQSKGIDAEKPLSVAPKLTIHVGQELISNESGKLHLIATGANYTESKNPNKESAPSESKSEEGSEPKTEQAPLISQ